MEQFRWQALSFHSSRKFFISSCINSGLVGLGNVMAWSGHSNIGTVNTYIKKGYNEKEQMQQLYKNIIR